MMIINLLRGRFSNGTFTQGTHYTIDNVPAGMTLSLGKTSLTQVILSLTGNAIDHNNADDISNLTITFLDAAFQAVSASEVINSTKNDIGINFNNPVLSYEMGNFTEAIANDGSISTTKTVTLSGDTFAPGPFQEGTHFTTAYVPTGLNLVVTRNSNTQVTLSLTGKAIFHANTYNINSLTIAFQDAAFANSDAAEVTNATKNDMSIDFVDAATLQSIAITTPSTKLVYTVNEALNISGLVVTGTYSDSSTRQMTITTANVTGFDSSAPAVNQVLTITVEGKSTTYTVTINAAPTPTPTYTLWLSGDCG